MRISGKQHLINYLIKKYSYKKYLEIGIGNPKHNFNLINIEIKRGIDPAVPCDFRMTSDDFFAQNKESYDIIFIDGLHLSETVDRDIKNSLNILSPRGIIIIHDCNPMQEYMQLRNRISIDWTGDVWKSIAKLRMLNSNLFVYTIDMDCGCGIVKPGKQNLFPFTEKLTYQFLENNRKELLNLITINEFINLLNKIHL